LNETRSDDAETAHRRKQVEQQQRDARHHERAAGVKTMMGSTCHGTADGTR
jgi:hypothetical protein